MKIVFVLECANKLNNGTTATCNRFAEELRKKGHEVTILGTEFEDGEQHDNYVELPHFVFPLVEGLIRKEGFTFARCDIVKIYNCIKDADLVHVFLPMKLGKTAQLIADALGIPVTTAFHLQPQNISSAIHLGHLKFLNDILYAGFQRYLYHSVLRIHCPSSMIEREIRKHHYKENITHVISNGVIPFFKRIDVEKPAEFKDKIVVTMSGRLAQEKRQDLIIKAVAGSKYNDRIQIILCGQGPNEKRYQKLARKKGLANPLIIRFCNAVELREILNYADVYVHASDFEIEGISAIEAITCGALPLISDSKLSATNSFSLNDDICLFHHGSAKSLRTKLEWLIEHPETVKELKIAYSLSAPRFALSKQVQAMEDMFYAAVDDKNKGLDLPTAKPLRRDLKRQKRIFKKLRKAGVIDDLPKSLQD